MLSISLFYELLKISWVTRVLAFLVALVIFGASSKGIQDVIVYGAFLYAVAFIDKGAFVWRTFVGRMFIAAFATLFLWLPISFTLWSSIRDVLGFLEIAAGTLAVSVIFNNMEKALLAMRYSAFAITTIIFYDLVRLFLALGGNILAEAHSYRPFILNHPNVSAMMAALSSLVFLYEAYRNWSVNRRHSFFYALLLFICFSYIIVIASRGVQFAFLFSIFVMGFFLPGWKSKLIWLLVFIVLTCGTGFVLVEKNPRYKEITDVFKIEDKNKLIAHIWKKVLTERPTVWQHTYKLIKERPLFGYGYGKRVFREVYYSSEPPTSPFYYPHCHSFWLKLFFEFGIVGASVHILAWALLAVRLVMAMWQQSTMAGRSPVLLITLMLALLHTYGIFDYPDSLSLMVLCWLVPLAIIVSRKEESLNG